MGIGQLEVTITMMRRHRREFGDLDNAHIVGSLTVCHYRDKPAGSGQLARITGLPKTTVARRLAELSEAGHVIASESGLPRRPSDAALRFWFDALAAEWMLMGSKIAGGGPDWH
jgi:hypothetical protein